MKHMFDDELMNQGEKFNIKENTRKCEETIKPPAASPSLWDDKNLPPRICRNMNLKK